MRSQNPQEHFPLIERLHTDVLEDKYGPISAKVIQHDADVREVHLIDREGISRTYAITFFTHNNNTNPEVESINNEIKSGIPIGKAFREHSYNIRKNVIDVYSVKLPAWLKAEFHTDSDFAKARLSEFYAKQQNHPPIIYGTVVEIYTPDFRGPVINTEDISQINPSTEAFEQASISPVEIWERLGDKNNWNDFAEQYQLAKEKSLELVNQLKQNIDNFINRK
jgi:hypothetical protein